MINRFCRQPLWESLATLVAVAQGRQPADLVIFHARLVDVITREVLEDTDIAIAAGRIAYLGIGEASAKHCVGADTQVIDAKGAYVAPGFLDGHIHVESAMVGVSEYARAVIPHGTVGIYMDPHEIANVCGLEGVRVMIEDARRTPLKAMVTTPSCVPAVAGFEDSGASIDATDIATSMAWAEVVGLGEMMNFPGVLAGDEGVLAEISATLQTGKTVTGHYSVPETDRGLNAYSAAGIRACHESVRAEDVLAKLRLGMYVQLREGSAWQNLKDLAPAIVEHDVDTRLCCLVSDDNHPHTLIEEGHIDRILRKAVSYGIDPLEAIQMASINTATCFHLDHELGSIIPGKCADLVFLNDLVNFEVSRTIIDGNVVAEQGAALFDVPSYVYPDTVLHTMHVGTSIDAQSFAIPAVYPDGTPIEKESVSVHAIGVISGRTTTRELVELAPIRDGNIVADPERDLLKVCVFDRHHNTDSHACGFVKGFGITGALAQTVAHDAHNLLVMGSSDEDMALAAQTLIDCGGGEVAVSDGTVLGLVELPIAGLMSDKRIEDVADQVAHLEKVWARMGCKMPSPFMTMGLISLACIPELRLTNRGYVDCTSFSFKPLVAENERLSL